MEKDQMQEIAKPYRVVLEGGQGEFTEKKSRFIATVRPVESEEEASAFIEEMKKTYWDASHNCSAFVIGKKAELTRCSDDGEPARTAGRPMLEVLLGEEIRNVAVVVTRYFGGTLLGTGGLEPHAPDSDPFGDLFPGHLPCGVCDALDGSGCDGSGELLRHLPGRLRGGVGVPICPHETAHCLHQPLHAAVGERGRMIPDLDKI